ncbi:hypothetical protein P7K49_005662 [Saguinus oedipus]|uniref:Uncharacterized protein n=1 Tax=Saguinus oedipus TaxID=9490 RepID=A0ABQ9W069_SAGOE|nr:hypothetical protein P7K49_005662 [Saguinus oedipus]
MLNPHTLLHPRSTHSPTPKIHAYSPPPTFRFLHPRDTSVDKTGYLVLPLAPLHHANLKRVAETWMDEFAEYIYQRRPEYRHLSTGDISAQKELRKQLKCKDFKWFMAAVAWDVPKYYPPVEPPPAAWGEQATMGTAPSSEKRDNCAAKRSVISHIHKRDIFRNLKVICQS